MGMKRSDAARAAIGRLLVTVIIVAAGLIVTSVLTTSSAATMSVRSASGASGSSTPTQIDAAVRLGDDTPAGAAIAALTGPDPERALALIPSGFATTMGYRPVVDLGVPANPGGGCSSPIALPAAFDGPCKTHDLGYDLLRYSADTDQPLGQWARRALDSQLVRRMHGSCPADSCWAAADIAAAGVKANSERQADGVPRSETRTQVFTSVIRWLWQPVVHAAEFLGSASGRAGVATLIAVIAVHLRRRSRPVFTDGWPTVWAVLRRTSIRFPTPWARPEPGR
ncbi:hypothetical protein [Williamsia phyllosphaerae]|uniref:Phospholipase A2 n=1 Tax=Williamsia phyllosphaerae TaxID=885042 RepID=A0ABQ1UUR8_9NOCA|nr:hypothetical protein [Williamsia phyllosphaerae]GGF27636.1 hypothetical protein GCM10007298_24360 [Williamsia phyllosphaerae]